MSGQTPRVENAEVCVSTTSMSDDDDDAPSSHRLEPFVKKARYNFYCGSESGSVDHQPVPCCSRDLPSSSGEEPASNDAAPRRRMVVALRAHHLAKAVFDNTINTMIENLRFPLPDFGDIMDGYALARSDDNLEDEAVRMAIRRHGLQKPCLCPWPRNSLRSQYSNVPFHHRTDASLFGEPSTSSAVVKPPENMEQDILSEAVNFAIISKGLGASHGSN